MWKGRWKEECLKPNRKASCYIVIVIKIHHFGEFPLLLRPPNFEGQCFSAPLSPATGLPAGAGPAGGALRGRRAPLFSERDPGEAAHAGGESSAMSGRDHAGSARGIPPEYLLSAACAAWGTSAPPERAGKAPPPPPRLLPPGRTSPHWPRRKGGERALQGNPWSTRLLPARLSSA